MSNTTNTSYTIPGPEMEWPKVTKDVDSPLYSEQFGTTNGAEWPIWDMHDDAMMAVRNLLASYKFPVYHVSIETYYDMGYMPGCRGRTQYVDSRTVRVWTFSAPNTPVVHEYIQGGDKDDNLRCYYRASHTYADKNAKDVEESEESEIVNRLYKLCTNP